MFMKSRVPRHATRWFLLYILSGLVGILGGLGAVLFRFGIQGIQDFFFGLLLPFLSLDIRGHNLAIILLPAFGGLIVGPITMRIAQETKGAGIPEVMEAVALRKGRLKKKTGLLKIIASSITIGSGGSAGREGPIAQIGATIGSLLGALFKMEPHSAKLLVVCGLSAGIAGTYNAPLGGALFGIEILLQNIDLIRAVPVLLSSVVGAATAAMFLGEGPGFKIAASIAWEPSELVFDLFLGLVFGLISVVWVRIFYSADKFFQKWKVRNTLKPGLGGLITGFLIMLFPSYGIMGVGYEGLDLALAGKLTLGFLLLLGSLKFMATCFSIGSGGSGGIFAPTLYIGGMFGGAAGLLFHWAFPTVVQEPVKYSVAGMAALFAGATQAPLNIMVMVPEMCGDFSLLPPIMASSVSSFFVAWIFLRGSSIYTLKLQRRGLNLRMGQSFTLDVVRVEKVMTRNVQKVFSDTPLNELERLFEQYDHPGFPVEREGRLVGILREEDLYTALQNPKGRIRVDEIISKEFAVTYPDETLHDALDKIEESGFPILPVVLRGRPGQVVGVISKHDIFQAYEVDAARLTEL
jgi:CIC family chloride channel protein